MSRYELHVDHTSACSLYDRIVAAGKDMNLQHFGNVALNSMRIEKVDAARTLVLCEPLT